ncbi:MAG: hypothetical protein GY757_59010, partial [bacterium]|nr:hypothetical protein [bacterium]
MSPKTSKPEQTTEINHNRIQASYHQERLWFIETFETGDLYEGSPVYHNIPLILKLDGPLAPALLEQAIKEVVNRHEPLRTRIVTNENKPFQAIEPEGDIQLSIQTPENRQQYDDMEQAAEVALEESRRCFSIDSGPLIRAKLIPVGEESSMLVITLHHLVADKYSLEILKREIFSYYEAYIKNTAPQLPELAIQYTDFAAWQREFSPKLSKTMLRYWKQKLGRELQALELPTDRIRAAVHIYNAAKNSFTVPQPLTRKIKILAQQEEIDNATLLAAAFKILLHHYSGQEEIVIGTSSKNRHQPGTEEIIGPIANLLVLRSRVTGTKTLPDLLGDLEKTVNEAYKYQDMPFDRLVAELKPGADMSRTALFDVLFQYEISPPKLNVENLKIETIETNQGWGKYDLNLLVQETGDETFESILVYNELYYDTATITNFVQHFLNLLESIVKEPAKEIAKYSLLSEKERRKLVEEWNNTEAGYPGDKTVVPLFEDQVEQN